MEKGEVSELALSFSSESLTWCFPKMWPYFHLGCKFLCCLDFVLSRLIINTKTITFFMQKQKSKETEMTA